MVLGRKKTLLFTAAIVIALIATFVAIRLALTPETRARLLRQPVAQGAIHAYRSFRKLPDLLFAPYFLLRTGLPVYDISIDPVELALLNQELPSDPFSGFLGTEHRVQANAIFSAEDFSGDVDIRLRGYGVQHWNALQKSWRINFKDEARYQGMEALNLVVPYDRWYFLESLAMYRAEKLGLTATAPQFARLRFNGQDMGVYLAFEQWSPAWLSRRGIPDNAGILTVDESRLDELDFRSGPYLSHDVLSFWKDSVDATRTEFPELKALIEITTRADDETFKKLIPHIVDLQKFYAWDTLRAVMGSDHQSDNYNAVLLFNVASGKFEFMPFDVFDRDVKNQIGYVYRDNDMLLSKRLYSIPEFREARNAVLRDYLTPENLADDLAFFDELYRSMRSEFFSDHAKLHNNFEFLIMVRNTRKLMEDGFTGASRHLENDREHYRADVASVPVSELVFTDSFARFTNIAFTQGEFLARNTSFRALDARTVSIGPGTHIVERNITIPFGQRLVVQPMTTLLMGARTSIISYGPVEIRGTATGRVRISPVDTEHPWGSMLIINAGAKNSVIEYADVRGGSGVTVNGIVATGMIAAHGSDLEIRNSTFSYSFDDDAVNIKNAFANIHDSRFSNTHSDALDLDETSDGSSVTKNVFSGPIGSGAETDGGDAIDLSWTDATIIENSITDCGDKGISVGESSRPLVAGNTISECTIGVAVKDLSRARLMRNTFIANETAIAAYRKKEEFGGGEAVSIGSVFESNSTDTSHDDVSVVIIASESEQE